MTRHRLDGRSYHNRIGKPFYGPKLRRIIDPEPEEPESVIERITEAWASLTTLEVKFIVGCIILAVFMATLIVIL